MLDYRNILRVASDPHKSMRSMELELHSSHHTIRKVLDAAEKAGVHWPLEDAVTNEMLMELLFPEEYRKTTLYVLPDYPRIHNELARKGMNLTMLWGSIAEDTSLAVPCLICIPSFVKSTASGQG